MGASEFLRAVKAVGKRRSVNVHFDARHGKGSHGRLYYGDKSTTLKGLTKEIGPGLLAQMLSELGLEKKDLLG
ncbi:hypothetical protein [Niveispirillum sp. KHB5.9]|uniref:hypothetical protein n=1 Tax=Niveispirillum sp. KHB5.9 TaxID=3400269 RepID=UPI003A8969EF